MYQVNLCQNPSVSFSILVRTIWTIRVSFLIVIQILHAFDKYLWLSTSLQLWQMFCVLQTYFSQHSSPCPFSLDCLWLLCQNLRISCSSILWLPGRKDGEKGQGVGDRHVHTAIFKMNNQQAPVVQHTELCSMLSGRLDERRVWGRMDTCVCMAEYLCYSPETVTTLLTGYTPIQNKKLKKKKVLFFVNLLVFRGMLVFRPIAMRLCPFFFS